MPGRVGQNSFCLTTSSANGGASVWQWPWQKRPKPPKVGGTRAPDEVYRIDFSKPHDFHFRFGFDKGEPSVLRRCVLIGFTTPTEDGVTGGGEYREYAHNRWLVLRQEDGRLLYAPRDCLLYIEESGPGDWTPNAQDQRPRAAGSAASPR
jgi:hypothetical protein